MGSGPWLHFRDKCHNYLTDLRQPWGRLDQQYSVLRETHDRGDCALGIGIQAVAFSWCHSS